MEHLATVLSIIRAGQDGDQKKLRAYVEFLADMVEKEDNSSTQAKLLRRAATGDYGLKVHPAGLRPGQVDILVGSPHPVDASDCKPTINCRECAQELTCSRLREHFGR